jgi:hypothetical protein
MMYGNDLVKTMPINLIISIVIGLLVGFIEEVPINLIPDALIFTLAVGMIVQEIWLVQWQGRMGGAYEKELRDYTNRMLQFFDNKIFWIIGIFIIFFTLGLIPLLISNEEATIISISRILCVSVILTLGIDPILGTLPKKDGTTTVGALVIYGVVIHSGLSGYPALAVELNNYLSSFSAVTCSSIVLTYLLLSTRWAYIRNLCYLMADGWESFTPRIGIPLLIILAPEVPSFLEIVSRIYIGS